MAVPAWAQVIAIGALKRTMWEDQRAGLIAMDTLTAPGIYGLGLLEHMRGEITVMDGRCHVARVEGDGLKVEVDSTARAPFFVYGRVQRWEEVELPQGMADERRLEAFLDQRSGDEPFFFRLRGRFDRIDLHVWDLPAGSTFTGPAEGARHKRHFKVDGAEGEVLGVFSRHHRAVFKHHDAFIHLHFLGADGRMMGHVDGVWLRAEDCRLFIGSL